MSLLQRVAIRRPLVIEYNARRLLPNGPRTLRAVGAIPATSPLPDRVPAVRRAIHPLPSSIRQTLLHHVQPSTIGKRFRTGLVGEDVDGPGSKAGSRRQSGLQGPSRPGIAQETGPPRRPTRGPIAARGDCPGEGNYLSRNRFEGRHTLARVTTAKGDVRRPIGKPALADGFLAGSPRGNRNGYPSPLEHVRHVPFDRTGLTCPAPTGPPGPIRAR